MQLLEKDIHDKQDTKWQVRILIMVARGQGESLDQCCLE